MVCIDKTTSSTILRKKSRKKIIAREKKLGRCNHVSKRQDLGVFTFFNDTVTDTLKKKLEWCDQKTRIRSADGSI